MKKQFSWKQIWLGATVIGATVASSFLTAGPARAQTIKADGSSTVFPITEAVAEEYGKRSKVRVTVGISGTGGGF